VPVAFIHAEFSPAGCQSIVEPPGQAPIVSNGGYKPRVIIRTGIGSERPLHPQHQARRRFHGGFRLMCKTMSHPPHEPEQIFPPTKTPWNAKMAAAHHC